MFTASDDVERKHIPPHENTVFSSIAEALFVESCEYAGRNEWHRNIIRDNPNWNDAYSWKQESKGKRDAIAEVIDLLFRNYSNNDSVFIVGLLREIHAREKLAEEVEAELSNNIQSSYSFGRQHGFHEASVTIREISEFGWPNPDPILDNKF